ncbi:hypothetical protein DM860_016152 [Cuscuta australis]|uniref:Uncharacterized protein n=1 Tax=Cuscuta australis TaxID=267555 RepID=A0A328E751_9ASTE|nr:hypothetical protein DM860_016152 [Cuscuta australis]
MQQRVCALQDEFGVTKANEHFDGRNSAEIVQGNVGSVAGEAGESITGGKRGVQEDWRLLCCSHWAENLKKVITKGMRGITQVKKFIVMPWKSRCYRWIVGTSFIITTAVSGYPIYALPSGYSLHSLRLVGLASNSSVIYIQILQLQRLKINQLHTNTYERRAVNGARQMTVREKRGERGSGNEASPPFKILVLLGFRSGFKSCF